MTNHNLTGKIDFKIPDDSIVFDWQVGSNDFTAYKTIDTGWYDVGNQKYLYKLQAGVSAVFENTAHGPQPTQYLEVKLK